MSGHSDVLPWLRAADPSTTYLAVRDLEDRDDPGLRSAVAGSGVGAALLGYRRSDGHWGSGFAVPQWTSTHDTLLELAALGLDPGDPRATASVRMVLEAPRCADGGLRVSPSARRSDVCINGMALTYCCHFGAETPLLAGVVDAILAERMADGGFNCRSTRLGATHSSVHSTTSLIEGFTAYLAAGHAHRADEVAAARAGAVEFLLVHRLFRSHRTGQVIRPEFTRLHYPARWRFDVLRGLDAVTAAGVVDDERLSDGLDILRRRRRADGRWAGARGYPGTTHVEYPASREPNPWITVIALRILRRVGVD
ncbi:hypothetical protein CEY15_05145 [Dietzia natronolimnaea]|uniref:Prenyltransferase n=1 Tax=Dietzia natronolimnaea TaxID=161920 RepID=A0A2A2WRV7_9ACTN|nr:hypothetical protein [Dietzia natronolimnaea]PAY23942.1 hypothetical protein CEY15_05145 [Dietzia natronolimnaea]